MDGGRAEGDVRSIVARGLRSFQEEGDPERVLAWPLAGLAHGLHARRDIDTHGRDLAQGLSDVGRGQATGQGDRHFPGDRGGGRGVRARARTTRVGTARGIDEQTLHAMCEKVMGCRHVIDGRTAGRPGGGRDMKRLPGRARGRCQGRGRLVPVELDRVGVHGGDQRGEFCRRGVGGHENDPGPAAGGCRRAEDAREVRGFARVEHARGADHDIQADRVRTCPDGREDASLVRHATDLHERPACDVGRVDRLASGRNVRADGGDRIRGAHERLADERAIEPERPPSRDRGWVADAGLGDHQAVIRDEGAHSIGSLRVHLEGPQVAIVDADQARIGCEGDVQLARIMGLHQRLHPEVQHRLNELAQPFRRMQNGKQEHQICARRPETRKLASIDHELLGQHRDAHGSSDATKVLDGPTEPVRLAQDGDGRGSPDLVGASLGDDVHIGVRDAAGRW